jgi:subtilisin family serine protease
MAIKIYSAGAADSTTAMIVNAYNYVRMMKQRGVNIRVTNNSYGGCPEACGFDQALKDAIDAAGEAGILNVFAAGNSGTNNDMIPFYPSSYTSPTILAVGASDSSDSRVYNYGPASVDFAAPGVGIRSTFPAALVPAKYGFLSGSSMSAPHASGAAALLIAQNPTLSVSSVKATLLNTVNVTPGLAGTNRTNGRLNIAAALQNPTNCTYALGSNSISVPTKGGEFTVSVSAAQNCDFAVKRSVNWLSLVNSDSFSGNSTVRFRVRVSPTISRSGALTIAGQTFTVNQSKPH